MSPLESDGYLRLLPPVMFDVAYTLSSAPVAVAGHLSASAEGVWWDGELVAPRAQIVAGLVVAGEAGPPVVRLVRRFPREPVSFVAPDETAARALLQELGLDASQTALSLPFGSLLRASRVAAFLWPVSLGRGASADGASRGRLRIAAQSTAEPELRAAIALAADEDAADEQLGAALERLGQRRAS